MRPSWRRLLQSHDDGACQVSGGACHDARCEVFWCGQPGSSQVLRSPKRPPGRSVIPRGYGCRNVTSDNDATLNRYIEEGFRGLQLADIKHANDSDVRMGTFALCAAFIDALALTYGHESGASGGPAKWDQFVDRFFGAETRAALLDRYEGFRCVLLHNFSASGLAFTHEHPELHLQVTNGLTVLNREDFVAEVEAAFERFCAEVNANGELRARALNWLNLHRPIGVWLLDDTDVPTSLAHSFTMARLRPANAVSGVGNGLQHLVVDTARRGDGVGVPVKKTKKKQKRKKNKRPPS